MADRSELKQLSNSDLGNDAFVPLQPLRPQNPKCLPKPPNGKIPLMGRSPNYPHDSIWLSDCPRYCAICSKSIYWKFNLWISRCHHPLELGFLGDLNSSIPSRSTYLNRISLRQGDPAMNRALEDSLRVKNGPFCFRYVKEPETTSTII